jgi:hypothetical protein
LRVHATHLPHGGSGGGEDGGGEHHSTHGHGATQQFIQYGHGLMHTCRRCSQHLRRSLDHRRRPLHHRHGEPVSHQSGSRAASRQLMAPHRWSDRLGMWTHLPAHTHLPRAIGEPGVGFRSLSGVASFPTLALLASTEWWRRTCLPSSAVSAATELADACWWPCMVCATREGSVGDAPVCPAAQ